MRAVLYRFLRPMLSSHTAANHTIKSSEKEPSMNLYSSTRMLAVTAAIVALLSLSAVVPARKTSAQSKTTMNKTFVYPTAKKVDQIDDYYGVKVADPYRWLEDPDSADSRAWIEAQNKLTFGFLNEIPERAKIKERLTKLWNYEKYTPPFKEGARYFYFKNDGLQNQNVLYTLKSLDGEPRVLLDPNKLSTDGTVALSGWAVSEGGKYLAYGLSTSGSDWQEWKVREIETGNDLSDQIKWVKFSEASWTKDGKGFFYSRYDEPNERTKLEDANYYQKLYYHRAGSPQSEDVLVYERKDQKEWGFDGRVTEDGRYLIVSVWQGTDQRNRVFYKDLQVGDASGSERADNKVVELINELEAAYNFIGNGGFSVSLTPAFSISNLVWMEMGGVYAQPNLRGGAEYGEEWHMAGTKAKKQNVFDDFIAAAEWLIANKYTSTPKLAISGGSNGGLLVGACVTQRPDLFGAALPAVGVMDMLRFHKFTIGWAWTSDYGSPDNAEDFKSLYTYSPLHNIKPGVKYPPTLITTADHDDRVVPAHSFKFAATLQAAQSGAAPTLIRIETKAGHGAGKPTSKIIEEISDSWGFLVRVLGMKAG